MVDVTSTTIITIAPNQTLTIVSPDVFSSGLVRRVGGGGEQLSGIRITKVLAGNSYSFGPFGSSRTYSIEPSGGKLTYSVSVEGNQYATQRGNIEPFTGSFALKSDDMGKVFRCDDTANVTITVPNDLPQGFNCGFIMYGTGTVTLAMASGAVNRSAKTALSTQYNRGSLIVAKQVTASNAAECLIGGDFA